MNTTAVAARQTRVLIAAQSPARRTELRKLLSGEPDFEVTVVDPNSVSTAGNFILILDLESESALPANFWEAAKGGVVLLADHLDLSLLPTISPRPVALLKRDSQPRQIIAAVRAIAAGLSTFDPELADRALRSPLDTVELEPGEEELTPRETDVLRMMTAGLTNREIASTLSISEHTVKFHIASIFGKMGTSTRTEAVTEALRRGLIVL